MELWVQVVSLTLSSLSATGLRSVVLPLGAPPIVVAWADLDGVAPSQHLLDDGERQRMARLITPVLQHRFAASHGLMRQWLLDVSGDPRTLAWQVDALGKPACTEVPRWRFNMSHSAGLGVFAVAQGVEVGVDIECLRHLDDASALARRVLTDAERRDWMDGEQKGRDQVLLRYWTRKEACLKALGWGLSVEPSRVAVGLDAGPRAVTIRAASHQGVVHVCDVCGIPGAVAALAWVESICRQ